MRYSYDEAKRDRILRKRGLDLADAPELFAGFYLSRADTKHSDTEPRTISVGMLRGEVVVLVVWTPREASAASSRCGRPMRRIGSATMNSANDMDDARPELDDAWFEEADAFVGERLVRRGRPPLDNPKQPVTIRLDRDVIEWFKRSGEGWQTRMNAALRKAAGI